MFVECLYMVGILAICQALSLGLQQVVLWCLASNSDTSFASGASILVGLRGLEKAFLAKDCDGTELIPVVCAIAAGLFYFLARRIFSRSASWACPRSKFSAAIECPKDLVSVSGDVHAGLSLAVTSKSARAWAVDSSPCWPLPRRSFHAGVYDACVWWESSLRSCRRWSCCVWHTTRRGSLSVLLGVLT